jgi:hypothetical protein
VISVVEIGYVRRSEITQARAVLPPNLRRSPHSDPNVHDLAALADVVRLDDTAVGQQDVAAEAVIDATGEPSLGALQAQLQRLFDQCRPWARGHASHLSAIFLEKAFRVEVVGQQLRDILWRHPQGTAPQDRTCPKCRHRFA